MGHFCFSCGNDLSSLLGGAGAAISRREQCSQCKADVHCCRNCEFYDEAAYHECRESHVAEWVKYKDKANYCDYFKLRSAEKPAESKKASAISALDDLFKK